MAKVIIVCFLCCFFYSTSATVPILKLCDGRDIPAIAFGTWLGFNKQGDRVAPVSNEVEQAVVWALEAGYRHIDTASIYKIEDQVGRALEKKFQEGLRREDVFVTTKLWNDAHARDAVVPALRRSLEDLNLDYVNLYLVHWPLGQFLNGTYDYTDYVETWQGMMEAKRLGLAKSIGVSNFNKQQIQRLIDYGLEKPVVNQVELNLNVQEPELLAYCKQQNIIVEAYTPFGSLFYNKANSDAPPPRVDDPSLVAIANKYNKTVPQVTLRYLYELGALPLPKSVTKSRIEQNIDIFDFELTAEEKEVLKGFDKNYRTIAKNIADRFDHPYFPWKS